MRPAAQQPPAAMEEAGSAGRREEAEGRNIRTEEAGSAGRREEAEGRNIRTEEAGSAGRREEAEGRNIRTEEAGSAGRREEAEGRNIRTTVCVVGAGNLGQAQAGHLASMGHSVRLYNRSQARIASLSSIRLAGALSGESDLAWVGTDLSAAIAGATVIFIDVPATGHAELAGALAPLLAKRSDAPLLVLHPGQTFGARHFAQALARAGLAAPPPVCELQTALYTSRLVAGGEASVLALKRRVSLAVYPASQARSAEALRVLYPQLILAPSTLHTGLSNLQSFIHPAVCLANLARIERGEPFRIYREGLSPAVGRLFDDADRERLLVCAALGVKVPTAAQWFALSYGVGGRSALEAMGQVPAYETLLAPSTLATRLLWEDVPTGLTPLRSLAAALDVAAPTLDALARMARAVCGEALDRDGWTLERLGLAGKSAAELRRGF